MTISNDELFGALFLVGLALTVLAFGCGFFFGKCRANDAVKFTIPTLGRDDTWTWIEKSPHESAQKRPDAMRNELYDVVIFEKATRKIDAVIGKDMRLFDGTGSGRNTAEMRVQTGLIRMRTRRELISEAKRIRKEITQMFIDAEHWNTSVRKAHEGKIDADPNGEMQRLAQSLDTMLAHENESLRGEYLCADNSWKQCSVVPRQDGEPLNFTAILSEGVRHLVPPHNIRLA